jgi:predicted GNAT superfamily acetyltransferase
LTTPTARGPAQEEAAGGAGITLRRIATLAEYEECVTIEEETWGAGFTERVPAAILMVAQKVGGVTAGAFDADGRLLGFVFGMTGVKDGRLVHWSDLLAVRPEARRHGIGRALKLYQRELLLPLGVELMYWTYDPLVARNAHLNLIRLGARVAEFVPDMYGTKTGSVLHGDLGTDRFVVEWDLRGEAAGGRGAPPKTESRRDRAGEHHHANARVISSTPAPSHDEAPVVNAADPGSARPRIAALPDLPAVRVEIPADLERTLATTPALARAWRETTREAFTWYLLGRGYHVAALLEEGDRRYYLLTNA